MEDNRAKRKEFLLRKNEGRLELEALSVHLQKNGITDINLLSLLDSDRIVSLMQKKNVIDEGSEMSVDDFTNKIAKVLADKVNEVAYLWTIKSQYCGLLELQNLPPIESFVSLLNDTYFGGYLTIYFDISKTRLDIDIDENPALNNQWYYSYSFSTW